MIALYLSCLLLVGMADSQALKLSSSLHFTSLSVGEDLTLECFCDINVAVMLYWYKQTPGEKPLLLSKFYKHDKNAILNGKFKNDSRFEVETSSWKNHLKISDVQISDAGTYYCISGYSYLYTFIEGTIVYVKGSGSDVPVMVHQSESETIQPGGSVTLNCTVQTGTCDGEHMVYWFKYSEDSHLGLIYTHGGRNDQCERNTQTHTCVHNLPMKNLDLSDAGTYYCAVASCGHILFGDGTKLEFEDEEESLILVYSLSGALAFTTILAGFLACTILAMYKTKSCHCTDSQVQSPDASNPNQEGLQDADNLHYAAVRQNRANTSTRQRNETWNECVYSSVRP